MSKLHEISESTLMHPHLHWTKWKHFEKTHKQSKESLFKQGRMNEIQNILTHATHISIMIHLPSA